MVSMLPPEPEMEHRVQKHQYTGFSAARPGEPGADTRGNTHDHDHNHHTNNNES